MEKNGKQSTDPRPLQDDREAAAPEAEPRSSSAVLPDDSLEPVSGGALVRVKDDDRRKRNAVKKL